MDATTVIDRVVIPAGASTADARSLYAVLAGVPDRRKRRGKRYPAALVLTLLLLAKMSGEGKLSGVAELALLPYRSGAGTSAIGASQFALRQHLSQRV